MGRVCDLRPEQVYQRRLRFSSSRLPWRLRLDRVRCGCRIAPVREESRTAMILMRKEEMFRGARRPLAMLCLTLGVAGCILPIVPGLPFFVVAARLLGPRDPLLRRVNLLGRRGLRGLRAS